MTKYKVNEEKMFADVTDGVAIIINGETGIYYGMNAFGTSVFENLTNGVSTEEILSELKKIPNVAPDIDVRFQAFVDTIVDKELVIPSEEDKEVEIKIDQDAAGQEDFSLAMIEYNDAQELLLADPIHEVKEESGWSPEKESLNPDQEDVSRREAKMEE